MNLKKNILYLSYQKIEIESLEFYWKMDFFLFYYYGDYLMLIMIEFFKERKKVWVYFVFMLRKFWYVFYILGILKLIECFY